MGFPEKKLANVSLPSPPNILALSQGGQETVPRPQGLDVDLCSLRRRPTSNPNPNPLLQGPIVWAAGRLIGDHTETKAYTNRVYGRCQEKDPRDLGTLATVASSSPVGPCV